MDRDAGEKAEDKASEIASLLESETFYESIEAMKQAYEYISNKYIALYQEIHERRAEEYGKALDTVKELPEWAAIAQDQSISDAERASGLRPITDRAVNDLDLYEESAVCNNCKATIAQMETDIAAVDAIKGGVIKDVQQMAAPGEKIERVRISTLFAGKLESPEDVETAIEIIC